MKLKIHVEGGREFRRAIRDADRALPKEIRKNLNKAAEIVAEEAQRRVPVRSGALRASIRPRSTQKEGRVAMGGVRGVDYAGWIDFGGTIAPKGTPIERRYVQGGRYLFPAFYDRRRDVTRESVAALNRVVARARLE